MGCMRTIKQLEKENQTKSEKVNSLSNELDKKTKLMDASGVEKLNLT